jgi:type IV secretion system protein VirB8
MNKITRESADAYYREAESWARDRQEGLRASRRVAWIVAGVAAGVALLEAVALVVLTPLKTVVPYTLLVDRQTGYVQALKPLDADRVAPDAALTQSFLVQYVIARESFDIDALQMNYRKVTLWSAEKARAEYLSGIQAANPESPLSRYPRTTVVETRVKSVSSLGRNVAMVRFDTIRRDAGGQSAPLGSWAAIIRYRFTNGALSAEDRYVNPLGFQVLRYQKSPETLPAEPVPAAPGTVVAPTTTTTTTTVVPLPGQTTVVVPGRVSPAPQPAPAPARRAPVAPRPDVEL